MTLNALVSRLARWQAVERDVQGGLDGEVVREGSRIAICLRPNPQNGQAFFRVWRSTVALDKVAPLLLPILGGDVDQGTALEIRDKLRSVNGRVRSSWLIAVLAAIGVVAFVVEPHIKRERHLPRLETSAAPLVTAIRAYQTDTGYAPPTLSALVPKYIERLPITGYRPVPTFSYSRGPGPEWTLAVPTTSLGFDVDTFQYYSRVPGWRFVPAAQVR